MPAFHDHINRWQESNVACPICLKRFGNKTGGVGQSCGAGQHKTTPFKCSIDDCEKDVLVCHTHADTNEQNHERYRMALRWMERNTGRSQLHGQSIPNTSLIIVSEEMEQCLNTVVDDYYEQERKMIHNRIQEFKYQGATIWLTYLDIVINITPFFSSRMIMKIRSITYHWKHS